MKRLEAPGFTFRNSSGAPGFSFRNTYVFSQSIAAFAGYHSKNVTMFNTVFQTLGGILPMTDSINDGHVADGLWSLPFSGLPEVFQILLIGSTRALNHVYTVVFWSSGSRDVS